MTPTRHGKIARLPLDIREELNVRIRDGEQGKILVAWLNALPEVHAIVDCQFGGRPIREQNLSEWRKGGYRDWSTLEEAKEAIARLDEESTAWDSDGQPPVTETLARWLAVRYAMASRRIDEADGNKRWRMLREMCMDVVELRRGDHSIRRLELERARVTALERSAERRWKRGITNGLEALARFVEKHPEAKPALDELARHVRHPFDPTESD